MKKKNKNNNIEDVFQTHFSKKYYNLLQAYTSNSTKIINNSPIPKKKLNDSTDKISSYQSKNYNNSQKNIGIDKKEKLQKKMKTVLGHNEIEHKSYISYIPYNKEREKENILSLKKDNNNKNKYQIIYYKTKRERESSGKNSDNNRNQRKKINNINNLDDSNKIYLPLNYLKRK